MGGGAVLGALCTAVPFADPDPDRGVFVPPLPNPKTLAIQQLGAGCVAKLFLLFETVFWKGPAEGRGTGISLLWDPGEGLCHLHLCL